MPIDFSAYARGTVLRVRCRDGVEGVVMRRLTVVSHETPWPMIICRQDDECEYIGFNGREFVDQENPIDVTAIIGEMVLKTN